jgi:hypothetical protein
MTASLDQHDAFTEETPSVPRWMRGDHPEDFADFPTILRPQTLDELLADCAELRSRTSEIVGGLQAATEKSRRVRAALGDED